MAYVRLEVKLRRTREGFPSNVVLSETFNESGFVDKNIEALDSATLRLHEHQRDVTRLRWQLARQHRRGGEWHHGVFAGRVSEHGARLYVTRRSAGAMVCWLVSDARADARAATGAVLYWLLSGAYAVDVTDITDVSMFEKPNPRRVEYLTVESARSRGRRVARKRAIEGGVTTAVGALSLIVGLKVSLFLAVGASVIAGGLGLFAIAAVAYMSPGDFRFHWHDVS